MSGTLAILGAGGQGAVVADTALLAGWTGVAHFDDRFPEHARCGPWPVAGTVEVLLRDLGRFDGVVVAIGDNRARLTLLARLAALAAPLPGIVHPRAWVSPHATVGRGTVVLAGTMVNALAVLGDGVIVNTAASVDHDCILGDGVHVSPGAHLAGRVRVGERSWIGIGAVIRDGVTIGRDAVVGAGAVVVADVEAGATVVGNPARRMER